MQVRAGAGGVEITTSSTHAAAGRDRSLTHGDTVLPGAVVVGVVRNPDLTRGLDQRGKQRQPRRRVRYAKRTLASTVCVFAVIVVFHPPEERQDIVVAPAL